jgi:NADH-quinone oxidoreductase subunit C
MADETKPPETPSTADATTPEQPRAPRASNPSNTDDRNAPAASSDDEKAAKIAEAKARASAAKVAAVAKPPSTQSAAAAGAPKAPVKKKEEGPKPVDASSHPLVQRLRASFDGAVVEALEFIGQLSIRLEPSRIVEVCEALKRDSLTPFDYLSDLTCVHFPDREESPFEIVYNLYSIAANVRVRLKAAVAAEQGIESVASVWPTANWMEREVFDLFGVQFQHHPDLRRLLLPPDWEGHPLRKEYPLEFIENNWTATHLPEFTQVQKEQLEQRRSYGLEILSSDAERLVREIFRADKEVMPKDK